MGSYKDTPINVTATSVLNIYDEESQSQVLPIVGHVPIRDGDGNKAPISIGRESVNIEKEGLRIDGVQVRASAHDLNRLSTSNIPEQFSSFFTPVVVVCNNNDVPSVLSPNIWFFATDVNKLYIPHGSTYFVLSEINPDLVALKDDSEQVGLNAQKWSGSMKYTGTMPPDPNVGEDGDFYFQTIT